MASLRLLLVSLSMSLVVALPRPWPAGVGDNEVVSGESGETPIDLSALGDGIYGKPRKSSGDKVDKWDAKSNTNPEENSEYEQGDILHPESTKRNGIKGQSYRWPNAVIPYVIRGSFDSKQLDMINRAIADYHRLTCVRFVKHTGASNVDHIVFKNDRTGCWSSVGRLGVGAQDINLQTPGCTTTIGTIIHEIMHAAGFYHEQSRPDRDERVIVNYQNIKNSEAHNFDKMKSDQVTTFNVPYAYNSVMHYSSHAFSANGKPTIQARSGNPELGQRKGFSQEDVEKINKMYECKNKNRPGWLQEVIASFFG